MLFISWKPINNREMKMKVMGFVNFKHKHVINKYQTRTHYFISLLLKDKEANKCNEFIINDEYTRCKHLNI